MFTYQLSEPRRPFASALQSTFIHASLIAGAVVATKAVPLPPIGDRFFLPISYTTPVSASRTPPVGLVDIPRVPEGIIPGLPVTPMILPGPTVLSTPVVDPRSLVPGLPASGVDTAMAPLDPARTIFDEVAVDETPTLLAAGLLRYPAILEAAHIEGNVTLSFVIDTEGRVEQDGIRVISATDPGFIPAAKEAVLTTRFHPAMKSHHPVRVRVQQVITFKR